MVKKARFIHISLDTSIAILIAIASLATALAAWRTNVVSSTASNFNRDGLINAIKVTAAQNEDWRKVYEEAGYARDYLLESAAADALERSGSNADAAAAANLRQYLLPGLSGLAGPLGTSPDYRVADGTFNTQKRFLELEAQDSSLAGLDPPASFARAEKSFEEQRYLMLGLVLLAASLFWFGLAEISVRPTRTFALIVGAYIFGATLIYLGVIEAVFVLGGA